MSAIDQPEDTDYELPGDLANPIALRSRHRMLQVAYSRRLNPRRMEYIFYAPWNHLFNSLVYDIPRIIVVPQHVIYREREHDPSTQSSDTISQKTKPQTNTDTRTPDFGFISAKEASVPGESGESNDNTPPWNEISIKSSFVCLLSEIKRPPSRSTSDPDEFTSELETLLFHAISGLYPATAIIFADKKRKYQPSSIILIAVAGEWYRWTELSRHHLPIPDTHPKYWFRFLWPPRDEHLRNRPRPNKSEDDGENSVEDVGTTGNEEGGHRNDSITQDGQGSDGYFSDTSDFGDADSHSQCDDSDSSAGSDEDTVESNSFVTEYHHQILENPQLSQTYVDQYQLPSMNQEGALELARATWTGIIRLGTPVSNQHLSAIHKRLEEIQPEDPDQESESDQSGSDSDE